MGFVGFVGFVGFGCTAAPLPALEPVRFSAAMPKGLILGSFTLSRDGNWLAYSAEAVGDGRRTIFVRDLRAPLNEGRELAGSAGGANPFFSPDAAHVGYFAQGAVWRMTAHGNAQPQRIADMPAEAAGATWTDDGRIVIAPLGNRGLMAMPAAGGNSIAITQLAKDELAHGWPHAVPGGAIVFTVSQRNRDPHLEVVSSDGSRARLRVPAVGQSGYIETGHLVYSYLGNLMAVAFDPDDPTATGVPKMVATGVQTSTGHGTLGRAGFAVSGNGTLTWLRAGVEDAKSRIVRVTPAGRYQTLSPAPAIYQTPRISPDGRHLAVTVRPDVMTREIHVIDISGPGRPSFTIRGGDNQSPAWMDNRRLSFGSNRDGVQRIYVTPLGGTPAPLLASDASTARNPASWTRPPRLLAFYEIDQIRGRDVLVYRSGGSVEPVVATAANERSPAVSPDGRWLAYVSDASGRDEIYLKPLDLSMDALQMTDSGASEPVWTRDGLCYRQGDRMMRVSLEGGAPGSLQHVFDGYFERDPGSNLPAYDIDRDGTFIMLKSALMPRELRVVRHWGTELARTVP